MCEFISWVEKDGEIYFLTDKMVYGTIKGRELRKFCGNSEDYIGHGAIRHYFDDLQGGENKECTDFLSPKNFPPLIVQAIKDGEFGRLGQPKGLLCKPLYDDYESKRKPLYDDFWRLFANPENRTPAWK